jgi:hypothetical protein
MTLKVLQHRALTNIKSCKGRIGHSEIGLKLEIKDLFTLVNIFGESVFDFELRLGHP